MKVFIVGGTGLLGSAAAVELVARGHEVSGVALGPVPEGASLPPGASIEYRNHLEMSDGEIDAGLAGRDALVFAAGVDERVEFPPPVYEKYLKYNVAPVRRFFSAARRLGLRKAVLLGSYFCDYARERPELELGRRHPYIRARLDQEAAAMAHNGSGLDVIVLELPYIFGAQPGRKPVWVFLIKRLLAMKGPCFYTRGGTTMVTVRQVAQCVAGAIEGGRGGVCYPVGWYNMKWREMLAIMYRHLGQPRKLILTVPDFMYTLVARRAGGDYRRRGIESGLDLERLVDIQTAELFVDPAAIRDELGAREDDIEAAIGESVRQSLEALKGRKLMGMRAE
jgi:nucleoside-diphosphate-sugar epimerase